ncbi:MAG: hypothetical protein A3J37_01540 [Alphaproteobacteria bacterium RIFCSPHIGHO2_12_FULL_45_9]|nr:MAG: hypothetical protein A3J37_01540 [Alphaproteobacteria bacterium RIFCSPHIGHO2_12_FULL_45_9]
MVKGIVVAAKAGGVRKRRVRKPKRHMIYLMLIEDMINGDIDNFCLSVKTDYRYSKCGLNKGYNSWGRKTRGGFVLALILPFSLPNACIL